MPEVFSFEVFVIFAIALILFFVGKRGAKADRCNEKSRREAHTLRIGALSTQSEDFAPSHSQTPPAERVA